MPTPANTPSASLPTGCGWRVRSTATWSTSPRSSSGSSSTTSARWRCPTGSCTSLREIEFLSEAKDVVRHHHERWDGDGYPDGLAGEDIPLAARVFAVADALDALTTDRPYRNATSIAEARERIRAASGTQFDPAVVKGFERIGDDEI